jgi:hypothetical protein
MNLLTLFIMTQLLKQRLLLRGIILSAMLATVLNTTLGPA